MLKTKTKSIIISPLVVLCKKEKINKSAEKYRFLNVEELSENFFFFKNKSTNSTSSILVYFVNMKSNYWKNHIIVLHACSANLSITNINQFITFFWNIYFVCDLFVCLLFVCIILPKCFVCLYCNVLFVWWCFSIVGVLSEIIIFCLCLIEYYFVWISVLSGGVFCLLYILF